MQICDLSKFISAMLIISLFGVVFAEIESDANVTVLNLTGNNTSIELNNNTTITQQPQMVDTNTSYPDNPNTKKPKDPPKTK
jgi:hypothetical protein